MCQLLWLPNHKEGSVKKKIGRAKSKIKKCFEEVDIGSVKGNQVFLHNLGLYKFCKKIMKLTKSQVSGEYNTI